jgi:hypothetical protein
LAAAHLAPSVIALFRHFPLLGYTKQLRQRSPGGLGTAVIQLAQAWKLWVIAGVGSSSKFGLLEELGVAHKVNYSADSHLADRTADHLRGNCETRRDAASAISTIFGRCKAPPVPPNLNRLP